MCNNPVPTSSQRRKMRIPTTPAHPVIPAPAPLLVRFVIHYITNRAPFKVGVAQRGLGRDRGSPEIAALKAELLREQISNLRASNLREADTVVDAKVVSEMLKTLANKLAMLLRQKLEVELGPRMVGISCVSRDIRNPRRLSASFNSFAYYFNTFACMKKQKPR